MGEIGVGMRRGNERRCGEDCARVYGKRFFISIRQWFNISFT